MLSIRFSGSRGARATLKHFFATDISEGNDGTGRKRESHTTWKFVDRVQVEVKGGRGGNGCVSFEVLSPGRKRPSGGSGGKGGNVYVAADRGLTGLKFQTFHFNARDGTHGGSSGLTGRRGEDVCVRVPLGTIVSEKFTSYLHHVSSSSDDEELEEEYEEEDELDLEDDGDEENAPAKKSTRRDRGVRLGLIAELNEHGATVLVARGGDPGVGNSVMAGSPRNRARSVPLTKLPGRHGEARSLLLELKVIADVGLVGYPNAGKSTLLRALSNARPKVASYPFTTLHPSVGVVEFSDTGRITVADVPGLIEGAHEDKGLGHDFLKHIERTKVLLYVVDGAAVDGREPRADLLSLQKELGLYDERLLRKPALVFVNKSDAMTDVGTGAYKGKGKGKGKGKDKDKGVDRVAIAARSLGLEVLQGSAMKGVGLGPLAEALRRSVENASTVESALNVDAKATATAKLQ